MDAQFLAGVRSLPLKERPALESSLVQLFALLSTGGVTIRGARDHFSTINRGAKDGHPQLVGSNGDDPTVLVSVRDLATIIQVAASSLTFGEALSVSGFRPAGGSLEILEGRRAEESLTIE